MKGGGALDFDGDALLALDDDDAEDALKTDDGDAFDVSFDALDMNMDAPLKGPNGTPLSDMDGFSPGEERHLGAVLFGANGPDAERSHRENARRRLRQPRRPVAAARPLQGPDGPESRCCGSDE